MTDIEKAAARCGKEYRARSLASQYRQYDKNNGYDPSKTITSEEVYNLALADGCKCEYCGCNNWHLLGIDRKDSSKGHTTENSVCACVDCNLAKGDNYNYDTFKKISKISKPIRTKFMTSELYQTRGIEDIDSLRKFGKNRRVRDGHVQELVRDVMKRGYFVNPIIVVEKNTMEILQGQHRVAAADEIYRKYGKFMPLQIIFVDFEGDAEKKEEYIRVNESSRANWDIADYVNSFKGSEEYDSLMEFMKKHNIKDYKILMHLMAGINKKNLKDKLDISDMDTAEKCIIFLKSAYGENVFDERCASGLLYLKNTCAAVKYCFTGKTTTSKTIKEINGKLNLMKSLMEQNGHDFMAYAPYYKKYVQKGIEAFLKSHSMKTPNAADIINIIVNNIYAMENDLHKDSMRKRKTSVRRNPLVAE